jgi:hypothetical protein
MACVKRAVISVQAVNQVFRDFTFSDLIVPFGLADHLCTGSFAVLVFQAVGTIAIEVDTAAIETEAQCAGFIILACDLFVETRALAIAVVFCARDAVITG